MRYRPLSLIAATTGGFLLATMLWLWWQPAPARAQFGGLPSVSPPTIPTLGGNQVPAQPIEIQALDPGHFVVVTRELRLGRKIGTPGPVTQMLVTVVSYYTVAPNGLVPLEHARMPPGWEMVDLPSQ